ncbi:hypothetical protein ACIQUB_07225 [Rhizobium sp. NPDC090275]|uniref:hypothetical protein n=1 Tax=Rhizobium sp. NPDC090275 TaxID=3364498 RepID=UPI00383BB7DD
MAELGGARTSLHWAIVREMWAEGETFALRLDGRLVGLFGFYPLEGGAEAWFNVRPELAEHMLFVIRQIRLTLVTRSYPEIVVLCTSEAGRRIAALAGFRFVEKLERGEIWNVDIARRRVERLESVRESSGSTEAGSGGAAASDAGGSRQAAG